MRNGEQAIEYLAGTGAFADRTRHPLPLVVLLDLNMPKKSGFEVLAWIRAQPTLKALAVDILSGSCRRKTSRRRSSSAPISTSKNRSSSTSWNSSSKAIATSSCAAA